MVHIILPETAAQRAEMERKAICPACGCRERFELHDGVLMCPRCGAREGLSLREVWCPADCGTGHIVYEDHSFRCTGCGAAVRVQCEGIEPWPNKEGPAFVSDFRLRRLTEVEVLPGITCLDGTFWEFSELEQVTLPEGLREIRGDAFSGCVRLKKINIPKSVRSIGTGAFSGCGFSQIELPQQLTEIDDFTFCDCRNLKSISIPAGVTWIGASAFHNCTALEEIVLPAGVTEIGSFAFWGCTNLKRITLPRSAAIGEQAFGSCGRLEIEYCPE